MRLNPQPMTCSDLMEIDEIRTEAISQFGGENRDARLAANKLSNVLGFMWRRELLTRYPAPVTDTSFARYSYEWSKKEEPPVKPILPTPPRAIPRNGPYLFPKKNGEVMTGNAFKAAWTRVRVKYLKKKGITFTEHDIRGKVATDMDDIFKANKLLGHSSIQMTEDYIKQRKTDVAEPLSRRKK